MLTILATCLLSVKADINAKVYEERPLMYHMQGTAYCLQGTTASGQPTRKGVCATGKEEWLGKTIVMYQRLPNNKLGQFIGYYEVLDTGCHKNVIDVWQEDEEDCQEFMDLLYTDNAQGNIYIQVIDAKG